MMLQCSECQSPVSSKARSCPRCGAPIHAAAWGWKLQHILASLVVIAGFVVLLLVASLRSQAGDAAGAQFAAIVGVGTIVVGLLWFVVARIGAWWQG